MKGKKKKTLNKSEVNFNRAFAVIAITVAIAVFWIAINKSKDGPDDSINLQAVDSGLLVKAHSPIKGLVDAKLTLVEFLDPECESCRSMHFVLKKILAEKGDSVRVIIRYLPLHGNSRLAISMLEEARELGKYEEALDILFEKQPLWGSHSNPRPELIREFLNEIGVNLDKLSEADLLEKHKAKIDLDVDDARKLGIRKTPTFFLEGRIVRPFGYEQLSQAIEQELLQKR